MPPSDRNMTILLVDDEMPARLGMRRALSRGGFEVVEAPDGETALELARNRCPDIVFLDIKLPGIDGMQVLDALLALPAPPIVIMTTAYGSERLATEAIKKGAYDYIPKPCEIDELRAAAARAAETISLRRETARLRAELDKVAGTIAAYGEIIGSSEPMIRVFETIDKISQTGVTVMIRGESGTGKELVAREIHRRGPRADKPFVVMNCAAVPETLVESELFGHEKGAFTGASALRAGKFELADGGTLLLDEIGDMSPNTQAKVLRVLQNGQFERLGGNQTLSVDVRIVSATHRDLRAEIASGRFREDLYYRLKVVEIVLPPLRHRREDIPVLAEHFLRLFNERHGKSLKDISPEAMRKLMSARWPGNVRQLRNVMEGAVVLASSETLRPDDIALDIADTAGPHAPSDPLAPYLELPYKEAKQRAVEDFERAFIGRVLARHEGNISRAASELGVKRQNLQQKMRELGMRP